MTSESLRVSLFTVADSNRIIRLRARAHNDHYEHADTALTSSTEALHSIVPSSKLLDLQEQQLSRVIRKQHTGLPPEHQHVQQYPVTYPGLAASASLSQALLRTSSRTVAAASLPVARSSLVRGTKRTVLRTTVACSIRGRESDLTLFTSPPLYMQVVAVS